VLMAKGGTMPIKGLIDPAFDMKALLLPQPTLRSLWADISSIRKAVNVQEQMTSYLSNRDQRPSEFDEAYRRALEATYQELDTDAWPVVDIRNPGRRHSPECLNEWLWGPRGEYTGFARVEEMDRDLERNTRSGQRVFNYSAERYERAGSGEFRFVVNVMQDARDHYPHGSYIPTHINPKYTTLSFIRFEDYESLAHWAKMVENSDRPYQGRRSDYMIMDEMVKMKAISPTHLIYGSGV
jgi:hypothetical protein